MNNRQARETKVKSKRAPAANLPLSAACRCASRPPSYPSVLPPEIGTQPAMAGFSRVLGLVSTRRGYLQLVVVSQKADSRIPSACDEICHFDGDGFWLFDSIS